MTHDLQIKFVNEIVEELESDWLYVEIHFEYFNWKGNQFEKYVAKNISKDSTIQFHPSLEALDVLIEMNSLSGGDRWSSCDFKLDSNGKYDFKFNYGMPPLVGDMLKQSGEL